MNKFIISVLTTFLLSVGCSQVETASGSANNSIARQIGDAKKIAANAAESGVDDPAKIEKISSTATRIGGVNEALFSPSGKFLAIQSAEKFFLLPTENLNESIANLEKSNPLNGAIVGFLPSDALIYSSANEVFSLEPATLKIEKLFTGAAAKFFEGGRLKQREIVVASNDLIVSGDGNYDWGGNRGNILKFDLRRKRFSRGARIDAFWYASVSPNGKYVLYEHGAEDNNNTDIYDIALDKNYPLSRYFDFKKEFPKYQVTDETPIAWVGADRFLADVSDNSEPSEDASRLALFDVSEKRIVWQKPLKNGFFPTDFHQLTADKALVSSTEEGINDTYTGAAFEVSLTDGEMTKIPALDGYAVAVSPDKKRVAFYKENELFVAAVSGADKKLILALPEEWKQQTAYKGMPARSPLWSPGGDSLILFGEKELLFVQLQPGK